MKAAEIRRRFLEFFRARGHAIIPSAPLVPENDPSVLFNTAGMQPLVPYLLGAPHPAGRRLANVQKCVRTVDIDEIGDAAHVTFFEMLGNWSLGDPSAPDGIGRASYFKKEAIAWSWELLTSKTEGFGLDPARLSVSVFAGDQNAPRDEEAAAIWRSLGIPESRIRFLGAADNWWQAGESGPCGPDTEMFYEVDGRPVEVWNDVFMEYEKCDGQVVGKLKAKNVDTGAGLERLAMILQGVDNIYDTDLLRPLMEKINALAPGGDLRAKRIIADHLRTAVFIIAAGVAPANTDRGYVLRRLLRRAVRYADALGLPNGALAEMTEAVVGVYGEVYPEVKNQESRVRSEIQNEESRFRQTLARGLREFEKIGGEQVSGADAFRLFSTYGFPFELTQELARDRGLRVDEENFKLQLAEHQQTSRAGAGQKFKGGLADTSEMTVKYHTATHLLHQALREVLGEGVEQKGSNITAERLRFDFSHPRKLTDEEKRRVEQIVNEKIAAALPVRQLILPRAEAEASGARHFFAEKYDDQVSVYFIGSDLAGAYSKEFCGGPHIGNTRELAGPSGEWRFKIVKEEAVAADRRRIKAVLT